MTRIARAWAALGREQRLAAAAALALFLTMFLPWYQQNAVITADQRQPLVSQNLNAFAVFSFIEAAVLLVAAATLALMFARGERRSFHLPGSDGAIVMLAGAWTALLLVLRLFDKPGITSHGRVAGNVGIQWGIFFALGAAGLLIYAGSRMRAGRRPEPPLLREERPRGRAGRPPRSEASSEDLTVERTQPRRARQSQQATTVLAGAPQERRAGPQAVPARPRFPPAPRSGAGSPPPPSTAGGRALQGRRQAPGAPGEQLSLEDAGSEAPAEGA